MNTMNAGMADCSSSKISRKDVWPVRAGQ